MCKVRCRHYECKHWFHEVEKPCTTFIKNPAQKAHWCENHKDNIPLCKAVKPVNPDTFGKETSMLHIKSIKDLKDIGNRNIIGGHCANLELVAGNDANGPMKKPFVKGNCGYCRAELERAAPKKGKGWLGSGK
ncbi:hypothetical protein UCDDA912_g03010 [Diaporthe ampelina]|uniref:Uncharacterized protein n=1 Tax=Diaporthe ampelina TaxID=1214573 RepID=A0A0G2IBB6_9PEZI|nr:hypothetical protein UCDDA912_g03010 [Diaporthe ampelina]